MTTLEQYQAAFIETFQVSKEELEKNFSYANHPSWDSVSHMMLVAELEDRFDIEMEMDDIIDFSSYEKGKEILKKYEVIIE